MTTGNGATSKRVTNAQVMTALNDMKLSLERLDFARSTGKQYQGERDLFQVGGYPRSLTPQQYWGMYERDPVAGRLVDMVAETTWRKSPEITEPGTKSTTRFTDDWTSLEKRLGLWGRLERVDKLARVGRFALLMIGTPDGDADSLKQEMGGLSGPDDVLFLQPYAERDAEVATWVTNDSDPRYGLPESYKIDLSGAIQDFRRGRRPGAREVHWSRVIHVAEGLLRDDVYGRPVLERCFNDLMDLQKVSTSTAEAFWQRVAGILGLEVDPEARIGDAVMKELEEQMRSLYHDLRRFMIVQGGRLYRVAESEPSPTAAAKLAMQRIATTEGVPMRVLFGSETGERASSEDMKSYLGIVDERRTNHAEPVLRALIDRLVEYGGLRPPGRNGYEVVWPALMPESEGDMAEANRKRAEAARALTPVGGNPLDYVEIDDDRNVWLRPTGKRGALTPEEMDPPEPEPRTPEGEANEPPEPPEQGYDDEQEAESAR